MVRYFAMCNGCLAVQWNNFGRQSHLSAHLEFMPIVPQTPQTKDFEKPGPMALLIFAIFALVPLAFVDVKRFNVIMGCL